MLDATGGASHHCYSVAGIIDNISLSPLFVQIVELPFRTVAMFRSRLKAKHIIHIVKKLFLFST